MAEIVSPTRTSLPSDRRSIGTEIARGGTPTGAAGARTASRTLALTVVRPLTVRNSRTTSEPTTSKAAMNATATAHSMMDVKR
jgi:hypothetical protein